MRAKEQEEAPKARHELSLLKLTRTHADWACFQAIREHGNALRGHAARCVCWSLSPVRGFESIVTSYQISMRFTLFLHTVILPISIASTKVLHPLPAHDIQTAALPGYAIGIDRQCEVGRVKTEEHRIFMDHTRSSVRQASAFIRHRGGRDKKRSTQLSLVHCTVGAPHRSQLTCGGRRRSRTAPQTAAGWRRSDRRSLSARPW